MTKYFHLSIITSCHKSLIHECVTGGWQMKIGQLKLQSVDKISSDNPQISQIRADYFGMNSFSSLQVVGDLICQI